MAEERILNSEQRKAVEHGNGPLLIIAGAGTGKTTVITERIKHFILKGNVLPSQILALTFTEKAAREMEERVDVALPYGYTQLWIATFHAFCDRVLRDEAVNIGLSPSYHLATEAETLLFLRKNIFAFHLEYFRPLGNPDKFLQALLAHFSRLKDEDVGPSEYLAYGKKLATKRYPPAGGLDAQRQEAKKTLELAKAFQKYEELKVKEGFMDFSDLIANALKLFRTRKNILKKYQEQFHYVLVDEFQDTNYAQNLLAILLAGERKNITVVGDDDQAIYRWRGAAIANIIQFKKHFPRAKVVTLTKNYRSTKHILDSSYRLIQENNPDRLEAKEKIDKRLVCMRREKGETVPFLFAERVEDEADVVAKKIRELTNYQYKDIAILVRANDHSQPFTRALERHRVPYQFLGPGRLFHQEEVKNLIAYLKVLYNFEDSASLYRVLTIPIFSLEPRDIAALLNLAKKKNLTLFEALERVDETFLKDEAKEKVKRIASMINRHLKRVPKDTAGQILYYFLEDTGLLRQFLAVKTQEDEKRAQNTARFFEKLKTYEVEHEDASVFSIVDWIELATAMGESPLAADIDWTENNAVNILTIHSSKGLEFPVVFLVNLVEGRFPTRERREQIPIPQPLIKEILPVGDYHLEEERRLFYVGMTRARNLLFFTASKYYGEGKRERKISPFVAEALGQDAVLRATSYEPQATTQLALLEWKTPNDSQPSIVHPPTSHIPHPINYLSYSQIQTFDICPLHYRLRYILKVPAAPTASQSFGTSIHSVLRDFYKLHTQGQRVRIVDALTLLEKNWISEGYQSKSHEKHALSRAKRIFDSYLKKHFNPKTKPLALELPFNLLIKQLKVGGRIDRIDQLANGAIEIIDYKTGDNVLDEKALLSNLQLTIYALAATEVSDPMLRKNPEEVTLTFHYVEKNRTLSTTRSKKQLEEAKTFLLEKAEEIARSEFLCSGSNLCASCEYKMLCSTQ